MALRIPLQLDLFGNCQCVVHFDAEVADGAFKLGVPEQQLHGADVLVFLQICYAAGKQIIPFAKTATGYPSTNGGSGLLCDLELDRPPRLPLNDHRPIADTAGARGVADHNGDQVATTKLAVDGEIEKRQIQFCA